MPHETRKEKKVIKKTRTKKKGEVQKMIDKVRRKTIARVEEISRLLVRTYLVDDDDASSRVDPGGYLEMYGSLAQSRCTGEPRPGVWASHTRCTVLSRWNLSSF